MTAQTDPQGNAGVPAGLDQQESREWMDALSAVIDREGAEYAHKLLIEDSCWNTPARAAWTCRSRPTPAM